MNTLSVTLEATAENVAKIAALLGDAPAIQPPAPTPSVGESAPTPSEPVESDGGPTPGVDPDAHGVMYDARIHSTPAKFKKDGLYQAKRGVDKDFVAQVVAEQKTAATPTPTPTPAAPQAEDVPVPAPVADPTRIVNGQPFLESALLAGGWTQEAIDACPIQAAAGGVSGKGITIVGDLHTAIKDNNVSPETVTQALATFGIANIVALALAPDKVADVAKAIFPNG